MATVTRKAKGGKWYAIYKGADGKQKWKSGYTDKAETQRFADRLEDEARRIVLGDVDPQVELRRAERTKPITAHLADYRAKLEAAGRTPGHIAYTIADVEALVEFGNLKSAGEVTGPLVDRWVNDQRKRQADGEPGNSNKTINRRVSSVQQFLRHLSEVGGVSGYVLKRYPKLPTGEGYRNRHSRVLEAAELAKLLAEPTPEHRRELYAFAARTGLRLTECRAIAPAHFDLRHKVLTVPAHVAKAKRDQTIPLHATLLPLVKKLSKGKAADAPLFGGMPTKQHVISQLRADCEAVKVDAKSVAFHSFRHTYCTQLARANVHPALLQKLARHADLKTTLKYYVHLQRADEADAIAKLV